MDWLKDCGDKIDLKIYSFLNIILFKCDALKIF
jgi:hypothetical protein